MTGWNAYAVRYASAVTDRTSSYLRYHEYGEPNAAITCDFYFWLLTSGDRVVLFDTGYSPHLAGRPGLEWFCDPVAAVSQFGVSPAEVSTIVYSHLHSDHVGSVEAFPAAEVLVRRPEWEFWTGPMADRALFRAFKDDAQLAALRAAHADGRVLLLDGETEPAPGLRTVDLPGHTPGQQGLSVSGADTLLLTSDALHYYEELERDRPFFIVDHLPTMYASFDRLRALAADGVRLVAGHDASDLRRYDRRSLLGGDLLTLL